MKLQSFDVETAGVMQQYALQPFRATAASRVMHGHQQAWLTSYAIGRGPEFDSVSVYSQPRADILRGWLEQCAKDKVTIAAWNAPFDVAWLIAMGLRDEVFACNWLDGMLLWRHIALKPDMLSLGGKRQAFGLKKAVEEFYPDHAGYDDGIDFMSDDEVMVDRRLTYNRMDAWFTYLLTEKFWNELSPQQQRAVLIEASSIPMVAETYVHGLRANAARAQALEESLERVEKSRFIELKLADPQNVSPEVINSPVQLSELLYQKWGLDPVKVTEKGALSTDKEALSHLADKDPRAKLLHEYREARNNKTKFAVGTLNALAYNGDGMVRPAARIYGTYTGRMTYSSKQGKGKSEVPVGIAIHQWKRDAEFRGLIEAPDGYDLLEFDFAGQEFRWMAVMSGDQTMLELCAPGEDAHGYMGAKLGRWSYKKIKGVLADDNDAEYARARQFRQLGKVGNLSCQYRTSANTLMRVARVAHGVDLSEQMSQSIVATYRTTYTQVPQYWKDQIYRGKLQGYVETMAGRRIHLGTGDTWPAELKWGLESTTINFPIQGTGADQKYLALLVARNYLPKVGGRFYFELHDGLFFVVPKQHTQRALHDMHHLLSNLPYEKAWGVKLPIQFPVDAKVGPSWGELKEVKL